MAEEHFLAERAEWRAVIASAHGPQEPLTRYVLLAISLHMSVKGDSCFPSVRLLATETALARTTIMKHLDLAYQTGWLIKEPRIEAGGQGWRRMEYWATIPQASELAYKTSRKKRGPSGGPPSKGGPRGDNYPESYPQGGPSGDKGGPFDDEKVVHQTDLSLSVNSSIGLPGKIKGQGQNRPPGRNAAKPDQPKPPWQQSDAALIKLVEGMGRSTIGKSRDELVRILSEENR